MFRIARDEALARNGQLSRDAVERDGTDANILLASGSAAADEVVAQLLLVERGLFLDSAESDALDRLVFDRYGLLRSPAAPAFGTVEFTTTALNPAPFNIPVGTILQAVNGTQYTVTVATIFPAAVIGPVFVSVRSVLAGVDQQAKIGTITSIISALVGSPTDLVVNNSMATAGASDAEDDPHLRARARSFFTTVRRGTKAAIEQGALAVPGVITATAFEVLDSLGNPNRLVQLVIADQFTATLASFSPTPGSYAAQSSALAAQVFAALDEVRAAGIYVDVRVAQVVILPIVLHLTFQAGADASTVTSQAKAVTVNYTNSLAPGITFVATDLSNLLRAIPGLIITGNEVASPNGNVVPLTLQVIRTSLEIVTAPAI